MARIYLAPPHMGEDELALVTEAFRSNWIAPVGPHLDAFEREFAGKVGSPHAVALSSGTAALHLALRLVGVGPGDEVICSTLTFVASANPILYEGASPVFVDSDDISWNMDPSLLAQELEAAAGRNRRPKAVVLVHLYGQSADIDPIRDACRKHDVVLIEDAAEALGAVYKGRTPGTFGRVGIFSFNGNKIITTSGGGMLVTEDPALADRARFLSTQARDPGPHYQHSSIGYNYRLSNVLAGIGRGQLRVLDDRVAAKRSIFQQYVEALGKTPGITFMPEAPFGKASRWLTVILVDPSRFGADREQIRRHLETLDIESRPVWKPLHLQPVFSACRRIGGAVSERLFDAGLCLPSGSQLSRADIGRVVEGLLGTPRR
jgi:dTDP-4-amino-4,6-dideoxygalactose transaminase